MASTERNQQSPGQHSQKSYLALPFRGFAQK